MVCQVSIQYRSRPAAGRWVSEIGVIIFFKNIGLAYIQYVSAILIVPFLSIPRTCSWDAARSMAGGVGVSCCCTLQGHPSPKNASNHWGLVAVS